MKYVVYGVVNFFNVPVKNLLNITREYTLCNVHTVVVQTFEQQRIVQNESLSAVMAH